MSNVNPDDALTFVEPTLDGRDAQELFDQAKADALVKLPEWNPREAHTATVLLEELALVTSELTFAIDNVPGAVYDRLLTEGYEVERDDGTPATATAHLTVGDLLGLVVPAGTLVRLNAADPPLTFTLDADYVVPAGANVAPVPVGITAEENTDRANGIAVGVALELIDVIPRVSAAELAAAVVNGAPEESTESFRQRGAARLARLNDALTLPHQFTAFVDEEPDVARAVTLDRYDPGQAGVVGDHDGHVTVAVRGAGGNLTGARHAELVAAMQAKAVADLIVHVIDPTITAVDVTITVHRLAGHDDATVAAAVQAAIEAYLDPETWPWASTVRRTELVDVINDVAGVDWVELPAAPAADVALAGVAPLADAGAILVTVVAP